MAVDPIRYGISVTDLSKLSRDMREVTKDLSRGFTAALKVAVEPVAAQARENASFSRKIPGTIKVTSTGGKAKVRVRVSAGGARAPMAAAFEHMGRDGFFRHPVFGHRGTWVSQQARPFLMKALTSSADSVAVDVEKAIDEYLRNNGL